MPKATPGKGGAGLSKGLRLWVLQLESVCLGYMEEACKRERSGHLAGRRGVGSRGPPHGQGLKVGEHRPRITLGGSQASVGL